MAMTEGGEDAPRRRVEELCGLLREAVCADSVSVWGFDAEESVAFPFASTLGDARTRAAALRWARVEIGDVPLLRAALEEDRMVAVPDATSGEWLPPELARDFRLGSLACLPVRLDVPLGILTIDPSEAADRWTTHLDALRTEIAVALLRHGSNRAQARIRLLVDLAEAVSHDASLDATLFTVCERLARHLGVRRACVYLVGEDGLVPRMAAFANGRRDLEGLDRWRKGGAPELCLRVLKTGVAEVEEASDADEWWRRTFDVGSALAVPLSAAGEAVGVLTLDTREPRRFSPDHVRLVTAVASQLGTSIELARRSEGRRNHLAVMDAIRHLFEEASGAVSLEEAGEAIARVGRDALGTEHAVAYLLGDEAGHVAHVAPVGVGPSWQKILRERVVGARAGDVPLWRVTVNAPGPVVVDDTESSDLLDRNLTRALRLRSYVSIPLLSPEGPLGLVVCGHSRVARRWSRTDREIAAELAVEASFVVRTAVLRSAERQRLEHLTELDRLKNDFLSTVSHELRTPLTVISGTAKTLLHRGDDMPAELRADLLARLDANSATLDTIVERLLDFARLESGRLDLHLRPCSVSRLVGGTVARLATVLANHEIVVEVPEDRDMRGDHALLDRVLENLLSNAVRHTPPGTRIEVAARREGDEVVVAVVDDGPGIPEEDLPHLGERFYRGGDPLQRPTRGLGLGLALVREILRLHGTVLEIESEIGKGSRFAFRLPVVRAPEGLAPGRELPA